MSTDPLIQLNNPHWAQSEVLREQQRFNVLCCGRRWGKSELAINILSEAAIHGNPVGYFAPTYKLLDGTYRNCLNTLNSIIERKHDNQFIELETGGIIEFWSLDNPQAGRSRKYKLIIVDEAAFVKDLWDCWNNSLRPTLTDMKGGAWFMSTPKGKNDFYKLFMRGKNGDSNWMSWQMPTVTNKYIDPNEIEDAKRDLPELAFNQEYLAQFNDNTANPFGLTYISQCVYPMSKEPAVCFGIDLAKSFDYTVIIGLDRFGSVCYVDRFQMDWKATTQKILDLPNASICIDSTGVGDPIGEDLARHRDVELMRFNVRTKQQLMEGLALKIQRREISFPEGIITDELNNFEYQYSRFGVKYSAPSGLHDDAVMALALAVHRHKSAGDGKYVFI